MPFATQGAARDAVYAFLMAGIVARISQWTSPIVVFDDKNVPAPPKDEKPYIRAQMRHTDRKQSSIGGAGGRRFRSKFQLTLKVYTLIGMGNDDYKIPGGGATVYPGQDTICDALLLVFDGKTTGTDAASFYNPKRLEFGEDEGRQRSNVIVMGDYDTLR